MRELIAIALDRDIPVLIGVPARNLAAWREFAGEFSAELSSELVGVLRWLGNIQSLSAALATSTRSETVAE